MTATALRAQVADLQAQRPARLAAYVSAREAEPGGSAEIAADLDLRALDVRLGTATEELAAAEAEETRAAERAARLASVQTRTATLEATSATLAADLAAYRTERAAADAEMSTRVQTNAGEVAGLNLDRVALGLVPLVNAEARAR